MMRNTLKAVLVIAAVFPALSYAIFGGSMRDTAARSQALRSREVAARTTVTGSSPFVKGAALPSGASALQTCASCHELLGIHNPAVDVCSTCHSK